MLRVLIIQALNGSKGPRAVRETGLGLAFMLARFLAGRIHEAWDLVRKASVAEAFAEHLQAIPVDDREDIAIEVAAARRAVQTYFDQPSPLLTKVRRKLAFHQDRSAVVGAYDLLPDDFNLIDFHTGVRGSTFYGAADTLAALAASHLMGSADPSEGQSRLVQDAPHIGGELETIIDGYLVAFYAKYLGLERFRGGHTILSGLPSGTSAKAVFFVDDRAMRHRSGGPR